jgi:hypothetical protein
MVRQIDIPKVTAHFCLFSLAFYLPHNSSVFVYLTSPKTFFVNISSHHPFVYLCLCLSHLPSALCLSLSLSISPTLSPLSISVSSTFCLSHLPSALCLISLSSGFYLSVLISSLCFFSVLLDTFLSPFPFLLSISRLVSLLYNSHLVSFYLSLLFLAFAYLTIPRSFCICLTSPQT